MCAFEPCADQCLHVLVLLSNHTTCVSNKVYFTIYRNIRPFKTMQLNSLSKESTIKEYVPCGDQLLIIICGAPKTYSLLSGTPVYLWTWLCWRHSHRHPLHRVHFTLKLNLLLQYCYFCHFYCFLIIMKSIRPLHEIIYSQPYF